MTDYDLIRREHELDYGRKLTVWAQDHLANRYTERTHFIFELLQNAEDALRERARSSLPTSVSFFLKSDGLEVRHFGKPFTPANVKSICAINESTKKGELTEIGRFGIGFKSVYAFTRRPEVHSGDEHFAIENFVLPIAVAPRSAIVGETVFWIPFDEADTSIQNELSAALRNLGSRRLLFLEEINEITWTLPDGTNGVFLKNPPASTDDGELITLLGEVSGDARRDEEEWLLFRRPVRAPNGSPAGSIAIAFLLGGDSAAAKHVIEIPNAKLVVFFPTDVSTGTGFLIQGPYRTTPSRDNVPANDGWNRKLIEETADVLVDALHSLRKRNILSVDALKVLPIDNKLFTAGSMFSPLFERVREALKTEPLLPAIDGTHVAGTFARLARSEAIRELLSPSQIAQLLGVKPDLFWLSDEITKDRAGGVRDYLIQHVGIGEITPEYLQSRLSVAFLTVQTDEWMRRFYEFLSAQKAVLRELLRREVPFVRCSDNTHVPPKVGHQPQVFLPSEGVTGFRTVKRSVCSTSQSLEFLKLVGLSEPDPVDDVVQNVLKNYTEATTKRSDTAYSADLKRILSAFRTDSDQGRRKLIEALRRAHFVRAVAHDSNPRFLRPGEVYRSTQRLRRVFEGVTNVWLVDESCAALRGESMRDLLQACGALDVLRTVSAESSMTTEEKKQVRLRQGNEAATSEVVENDTDCPELAAFLALLPQLSAHDLKNRSSEFWLLLRDTLHDRRENYFQAAYKWGYMHRNFAAEIPAMWVRRLQRKRWAANDEGDLKAPHEICLSDACHEIQSSPNAFLAEILGFRPEAIKELAEKEGIDLETLNLLKRHKVTAEQLRELLGAAEDESDENEGTGEGDGDTSNTEGDDSGASDKEDDADDESENASEDGNGSGGEAGSGNGGSGGGGSSGGGGGSGGGGSGGGSGSPNKGNGDSRTAFYTYVGLNDGSNHEEDENLTPDERRNIEEAAISFILSLDGNLQRTPTNNPGFDLFEGDSLEYVARFVEVKSKKGAWNGAVALSEEQFRLAATEGERFWLYVVEFAQDGSRRRLHKIQDPAGHTRYYTFDAGWKAVAEHQNSEGQTS